MPNWPAPRPAGRPRASCSTTVVSVANERRRDTTPLIRLDVEPQPAGPATPSWCIGHDSRLGQVVTNLIDNARSFSPPDGEVRVVAAARARHDVEIIVEDDGPGIPPHALERIFERFYTDRPEQGFGQNSGLGLSISRQIVEAHGGRDLGREPARPGRRGAEPTVRRRALHRRLPRLRGRPRRRERHSGQRRSRRFTPAASFSARRAC